MVLVNWLLGVVVVAVIPGIGEELLFRGLIQGKLAEIFRNPHIAIWVTGFLFGLFPFSVLWSGAKNVTGRVIWLPILVVWKPFISDDCSFFLIMRSRW